MVADPRPHASGHFKTCISPKLREIWNQKLQVCTPVIPAVRRVRQEDCWEFEVSLDYILLGKPDLETETLSQKRKKETKG